jgi:S1-C subfamily serine protease
MEQTALRTFSADVAAIAQQGAQSTVALRHRGGWFSGFCWRGDVIVSASELIHANAGDKISVIGSSQSEAEGIVIGRDPSTDVALVRAHGMAHAVKPATDPGLALGDVIVAVARSPHGPTCAVGCVALAAPAWRSMRGGEISARVWLDIGLMRHAEGAPVFSAGSGFVGMAVYGPRGRVVLIPAQTIARVGDELLAHGRVRHAYLGMGVQKVAVETRAEAPNAPDRTGLMIVSLDPKGPAAQAGLQQGDIVLALDGNVTSSARTLAGMLRNAEIGRTATLQIMRSGRETSISVALGESPLT